MRGIPDCEEGQIDITDKCTVEFTPVGTGYQVVIECNSRLVAIIGSVMSPMDNNGISIEYYIGCFRIFYDRSKDQYPGHARIA